MTLTLVSLCFIGAHGHQSRVWCSQWWESYLFFAPTLQEWWPTIWLSSWKGVCRVPCAIDWWHWRICIDSRNTPTTVFLRRLHDLSWQESSWVKSNSRSMDHDMGHGSSARGWFRNKGSCTRAHLQCCYPWPGTHNFHRTILGSLRPERKSIGSCDLLLLVSEQDLHRRRSRPTNIVCSWSDCVCFWTMDPSAASSELRRRETEMCCFLFTVQPVSLFFSATLWIMVSKVGFSNYICVSFIQDLHEPYAFGASRNVGRDPKYYQGGENRRPNQDRGTLGCLQGLCLLERDYQHWGGHEKNNIHHQHRNSCKADFGEDQQHNHHFLYLVQCCSIPMLD